MTSFPTTGPITVSLDIVWGDIAIVAGDETATVVEVSPTDPAKDKDRRSAEATTVTFADGRLRVVGPKNGVVGLSKKYGSVQVSVRVPSGSELDAHSSLGTIVVEGELGRCGVKTTAGDIRLQSATSADLRTGLGAVIAGDVAGEVYCSTGSGSVSIDRIGGRGEVKNSNGDTQIGDSGGPLRVKAANGTVTVERAKDDVLATSANGNLRVGSAERGSVQLKTSLGRIEIGIPEGTSALLDLGTSFGTVRSALDAADRPAAGDLTVEVHARTSAGDIDVLRVPTVDA